MEEKRLYDFFSELGLSKRKAEIYIYLSKKGVQKAQSIATHLGIDRAQTYRLLRSLKHKGVIEETIESPTRYLAIPIENLIEAHLKDKKSEIASLEAEKMDIIDYFKSVSKREPESPMAKFQIITGRNGIYTKILQMVNNCRREVAYLTTNLGLVQEDTFGLLDRFLETAEEKKDLRFKMLANISQENLSTIKNILKRISESSLDIEWRHTIVGSSYYPRFVIEDDREILLHVSSKDKQINSSKDDHGLWVSSKMFVSTMKASFNEIWRNAINVNERIKELETGIPLEKTLVINEPIDTRRKLSKVLKEAENEIILILSSVGLNKLRDKDQLKKYSHKGIKFRIMAPIDLDNLGSAQELSKLYKIKHVSINYLTMMIVDSKHLFIFKAPSLEEKLTSPFYLRNTFYTNDKKFVERVKEFLNDIWKRGTSISELGSVGSRAKNVANVSESDNIFEVMEIMLKNNVRSVLVTRNSKTVGIIDQKDILNKMLKTKNDTTKIIAKEIMSTPILIVDAEEPLITALKTIKEKQIPRLAVMKNGKLVAMLS